jgi:Flp pilus assembly protein CpaB
VQVLAAGTKIERDTDRNKPMPVSVVTLLVDPEEAERLTLASTEGKIQLALRNPSTRPCPRRTASGRRPVRVRCADPHGRRPHAPRIRLAIETRRRRRARTADD